MGETSIEWTDVVWNPTRGCSRISPGCGGGTPELKAQGGCYAERMAYRFSGPGLPYEGLVRLGKNGPRWTGKVPLIQAVLRAPLGWKKPKRVFVNSMSDLFHEAVSDDDILAVFAVMAAAKDHTFQILTKRADRMCDWFKKHHGDDVNADFWTRDYGVVLKNLMSRSRFDAINEYLGGVAAGVLWPLPNVHLGVSVESMEYAGKRIPHLFETPAAVRFVSAEPLLGSSPFSSALRARQPFSADTAPERWADFPWPAWVPQRERDLVTDFWGPTCGRGPREYARDMLNQGAPTFGKTATLHRLCSKDEMATGRFVHRWNNIGVVVHEDGTSTAVSFSGSGSHYGAMSKAGRGLDQVIVGGESGPGSRPFDMQWGREIVANCMATDTPVFVKQMGANVVDRGQPVRLKHKKGADMSEWPAELRHRMHPGDSWQ